MIQTRRSVGLALGSLAVGSISACAAGYTSGYTPAAAAAASAASPPGAPYKKASSLAALPDFLPGLGTLYVDPATLPVGPWLAYDHSGRQVSTLYMVPLKDLDAHKDLMGLKSPGGNVVRVDFMYNAGHPGVPVPHYHVILWHFADGPESVAK
ncbi:MAG: hypothetical protein ACREF0_06050 [Acetobacteraceae bacterium]